jgi:hypothetical protein
MFKIKTKFGTLYLDKLGEERINIYDSNKKYLTHYYFYNDYDENLTEQEYYKKHYVQALKECNSLECLINFLGIDSYTLSDNWEDLIEDIYGFDYYEPVTKKEVINNDYVNKIGKYYLLNMEW